MKHVSISTATLTFALIVLTLSGCGPKAADAPVKSDSAPAAKLQIDPPCVVMCKPGITGGRLIITSFTDPKTFNPITQNETSSQDIINMMFDGLVKKNQATQDVS